MWFLYNSFIGIGMDLVRTQFFRDPLEGGLARWGVVEWIERPLIMLKVRGSNPGHSISKNTISLHRSPRSSLRSRAHPRISELSERGRVKPKQRPPQRVFYTTVSFIEHEKAAASWRQKRSLEMTH